MPWKEVSRVACRREFVMLAAGQERGFRQLCRGFGVSRTTGYQWLRRFEKEGDPGLVDRSHRPRESPRKTAAGTEDAILKLRREQPAWGARKLRRRLEVLGHWDLPAPSTVHAILLRHGLVDPQESAKHRPWQRFEHEAPNQLWQMDFKGHFATQRGGRCHPLTVLDDHSRFALGLEACANEKGTTVQQKLTGIFRRYGLPERMTMDNGSPWGSDSEHPFTPLTLWLIRLGIRVSHSRPFHPQTQGKDERFHRTLKVELLERNCFQDVSEAQRRFDPWRNTYNLERPHQALGMEVPASRYRVSARAYPEALAPIEYGPSDIVRRPDPMGRCSFAGRRVKISRAVAGYPVAFRQTSQDAVYDVYFCTQRVAQIDLRDPLET